MVAFASVSATIRIKIWNSFSGPWHMIHEQLDSVYDIFRDEREVSPVMRVEKFHSYCLHTISLGPNFMQSICSCHIPVDFDVNFKSRGKYAFNELDVLQIWSTHLGPILVMCFETSQTLTTLTPGRISNRCVCCTCIHSV